MSNQLQDDSSSQKEKRSSSVSSDGRPLLEQSPGVLRIQAVSASMGPRMGIAIVIAFVLMCWPYGLDAQTRSTYQSTATASFQQHSLIATVQIVRSVMGAAIQPPLAKACDLWGRNEIIIFAFVFTSLGGIVQSTATNIQAFAGGAVLYQVGYSAFSLICQLITADLSSLRWRLVWNFLPGLPYIVNTWVGGFVTSSVLASTTWRFGLGMWTFLVPLCSLPLVGLLFYCERQARKAGLVTRSRYPKNGARSLFWESDIVGMFLLAASLCMVLIPFTLAGGTTSKWQKPYIIALLVVGVFAFTGFVFWEAKFARYPAFPAHLFRNRTIVGALGVCAIYNLGQYLQADYIYTQITVMFNNDVETATRTASLLWFISSLVGPFLGLLVVQIRYVKPLVVACVPLYLAGFGCMIGSPTQSGVVGGQIVLGFAGALAPAALVLLQSEVSHEHLALGTSMFTSALNIGSAVGYLISGALWTQVLPRELNRHITNTTLATSMYNDPFTAVYSYAAIGTPEREGMVAAYHTVARLLWITCICFAVPLAGCALMTRNPRLGDEQTLVKSEGTTELKTEEKK